MSEQLSRRGSEQQLGSNNSPGIPHQKSKPLLAKISRLNTNMNIANILSTKNVTAQDVEKQMIQLRDEMSKAPKAHFQTDNEKKIIEAADLDPFPVLQNDKKKNQKQEQRSQEEDIEEMFKGRLTQKEVNEKIKALKDNPEIIQKYIRRAEESQRIHNQQKAAAKLNRKLAHRKLMADLSGAEMKPLIENFNREHKKALATGYFTSQTRLIGLVANGEQRDLQIQAAKLAREREAQRKHLARVVRPENYSVLPAPFVCQKNRLQKLLYMSSRLNLLFTVSSFYSEVRRSNDFIEQNANFIRKNLLMRFCYLNFQNQKKSAIEFQKALRRKRNQLVLQLRMECLNKIKQFTVRNYQTNTFLGAIQHTVNAGHVIHQAIVIENEISAVRCEFIVKALQKQDREMAILVARKEMYDQDCKEKKASKKQVSLKKEEEFNPDETQITDKLLPTEELTKVAAQMQKHMKNKYQNQLTDVFAQNCDSYQNKIVPFCLIPNDDSCRKVLSMYRVKRNEDLEWVQCDRE
ncbi:Conserved_hypothetical protein [Hexamita inflata]|uniref:Uncharacterized protein n=1 Tax=Hexamita inflata TaxID=28002 RepID=A0AA86QTB4_9EUKA|nr:Conserved hypothetical protein [Hexamita inflata]